MFLCTVTDCYCCPNRSRDRTSSEGTHPHALGTAWLEHILVAAVGMRRSGDESCFLWGVLANKARVWEPRHVTMSHAQSGLLSVCLGSKGNPERQEGSNARGHCRIMLGTTQGLFTVASAARTRT